MAGSALRGVAAEKIATGAGKSVSKLQVKPLKLEVKV
jgi:hypothetical protein